MLRRIRPRRAALVAAAALLLVIAACGDDDATSASSDDGGRVDDVAALAAMLDGIGNGCELEYEGLTDDQREVSICTLGDEVAELAVWSDVDALDELRASAEGSGDPVVTGSNWSIDVTGAELADQVAEATGGRVTS
ncbi:MAG: hypothetical protein U5K30_00095 [Acidimicrobiales bacterium]|nr:hypothetical protein [Acidimicrobiales bacterium]